MNKAAQVAVIGAGTMGTGIAQLALARGFSVGLCDPGLGARTAAARAIESSLGDVSSRLTIAADLTEFGEPELVIEAVPEALELKREVLQRASERWPSALIASNTSSLSLTELSRAVGTRRCIGMHFFNPVPQSELIEIVLPDECSPEVIDEATAWCERFGKTKIEVRDSPGFATTRLGLAIGLEAIRMLEQGVASAEDIDRAMVLGYKFPIGPLRLTDLIGLDVRLSIARHLSAVLGDRFSPPDLLEQLVADGRLGRKTGSGFFEWK